ncbi:YheC/YheD family protein [Paenibacillus medicaginis]|uniref:YheC/YheD family protein n=1 Tax=Paenibacillus medicaginis TaxID=1470560 RepID=A0ABV5C551_9BACL
MSIQRVSSKWAKTIAMLRNPKLIPYIPDTRLYSRESLEEMLKAYKVVYVKPDSGTYGLGVMRAEVPLEIIFPPGNLSSIPDGPYSLRFGTSRSIYQTLGDLHEAIMSQIARRTYIIQRGIQLLNYQGRPFDLRILTQKNLQDQWETTGFIGRVAAAGKVITNYHSGGSIAEFQTLLAGHSERQETARLERKLAWLGERAGRQLERSFPRLKEIGLDIAIDEKLRPWILEINTLPSLYVFGKLSDKNIYKRIRKYAIAYGRIPSSTASVSTKKSSARTKNRPTTIFKKKSSS